MKEIDLLGFVNFFFLAISLFLVFIYATRLRFTLQRVTELRKTAEKFQALFQATSEGVFRCALDGRVLVMNQAGAGILGLAEDQDPVAEGLDLTRFFAEREQVRQLTRKLEEGGRINGRVVDIQTLEGQELWVELSMHLRMEEGVPIYEGIFRDVTARIRMERELQSYREHLERLVQVRTTELEGVNQRLRLHETQLRSLSQQQTRVQENERKRIAQELHDEAGQLLSAVKIDLDRLQGALDRHPDTLVAQKLDDAAALTERLMQSVHEMALNLRPAILDDLGLMPTLHWFIRRYESRCGLAVALCTEGVDERFDPDLETLVYRVVQETLNNTAKYAEAQSVRVGIQRREDQLTLQIQDDGKGFDPDTVFDVRRNVERMGLVGIRERVRALGGEFDLQSAAGQGTRILIDIPLGDPA